MKRYYLSGLMALFSLVTLLTACNLGRSKPTQSSYNLLNTAAAQTVQAYGTQIAGRNSPTPRLSGTVPVANSPLVPTGTATLPSGKTPTPTIASTPCSAAQFIEDITIPDGTTMFPGTLFTKTWKIKNIGSCKWDADYSIVFGNEGDSMSGPASKPLEDLPVDPGKTTTISVELVAPQPPGKYKGVWALQDADGRVFGKFWVEINVQATAPDKFLFTDNLCSAEWKNDASILPCPGSQGDASGYVLRVDRPKLKDGHKDNEPALVTVPQQMDNGMISGKFFPFIVPANSHFKTIVGCLYGATQCNVKFTLKYQIESGAEQTLGEWTETHDKSYTRIDIALDSLGLTGKMVTFTFIVSASGAATTDQSFWLNPMISP